MSQLPTFEQLVRSELSKYDDVIPKVEELKAQYMSLTIESIEDKDGYQQVKDAIRFIITKRNEIEEKRKELKADSLAYGRAVDARAREITSMITPIEEYLKEQKARIDDEFEQIRVREEQEKQARLRSKHNALLAAGMNLVGNEYVWTNPNNAVHSESLASVNLETLSDIEFEKYVEKLSGIIKKETALFEEAAKKRKAEEDAIAEERQRLFEEQRKLKEEQEMMRKEIEQMKSMRTLHRITQLTNLGLVVNPIVGVDQFCYLRGTTYLPIISSSEVKEHSLEDWNQILQNISQLVDRYKAEDEKNRLDELKRKAEQAEAIRKEQEEKAEQERIAGLSDKEKVSDYCKRLLEIPTPEVKTMKWKKELKVITTTIVEHLG